MERYGDTRTVGGLLAAWGRLRDGEVTAPGYEAYLRQRVRFPRHLSTLPPGARISPGGDVGGR